VGDFVCSGCHRHPREKVLYSAEGELLGEQGA
jgi:hypothetical protein